MKHSPFSSCAERGAWNQDARSFPTPWWTGQEWRWNLPERARLHRGGPDFDHLQGWIFRRARLLLSGHSWSLRGRRCPHHAQSLLWVCPFALFTWRWDFSTPPASLTHTQTLSHQQCKEFMTCFVTITASEVLWPSITAVRLFTLTYFKVAKWCF